MIAVTVYKNEWILLMITLLKIYLLVRSKGLGIGLETVIGQKIMVDKIRFHLLSLFCYGNTLTEKKKRFPLNQPYRHYGSLKQNYVKITWAVCLDQDMTLLTIMITNQVTGRYFWTDTTNHFWKKIFSCNNTDWCQFNRSQLHY